METSFQNNETATAATVTASVQGTSSDPTLNLPVTPVKKILELRAIHATSGEVLVGHYDDEALFNHHASLLNADHHIYSPINPINPASFPVLNVEPRERSKATSKSDVLQRVKIPHDIDSVREKNQHATDEQKAAAFAVAEKLRDFWH